VLTDLLRYAIRGIRRAPLFTSVAVMSVALGIGTNTATFTLMDQLMLRKLPIRAPQQLVMLNPARPPWGGASGLTAGHMTRVATKPATQLNSSVATCNLLPVLPSACAARSVTEKKSSRLDKFL